MKLNPFLALFVLIFFTPSGALAGEAAQTPVSEGLQKFLRLPEGETVVTEDIANAPEFLDAARDAHCQVQKIPEPARALHFGSTRLLIINCHEAIVPFKTLLIYERGASGRKYVHALAMPVYALRLGHGQHARHLDGDFISGFRDLTSRSGLFAPYPSATDHAGELQSHALDLSLQVWVANSDQS